MQKNNNKIIVNQFLSINLYYLSFKLFVKKINKFINESNELSLT